MINSGRREVIDVNAVKTVIVNVVKNMATAELKHNANQTSCGVLYQPRVPAALKHFKKERP